jgi:hypothetical protein
MVYETIQSNEFWPFKLFSKYLEIPWVSNSQNGSPLGNVWVHSFILPHTLGSVNVTFGSHIWPSPFYALCLGCKSKVKAMTCLIVHNHIHLSFFMFLTKIKNSHKYMVPKCNANIKFKLNLRWFKYMNIKILDNYMVIKF